MGDAAGVFEQIAVIAEVWRSIFRDAEHETPVRHRVAEENLNAVDRIKLWEEKYRMYTIGVPVSKITS